MTRFSILTIALGALALAGPAAWAQGAPGRPSDTQDAMDHGVQGTAPSGAPSQAMPAPQAQPDDPAKPVKLAARLDGKSETGKGDDDAIGVFAGRLNRAEGQLCYSMKVVDLKQPTSAKIHAAPAGSKGDVALTLETPVNGEATGCIDVAREVADALVATPQNFYINVENREFSNGAIRGQLSEG